MSTAEENNPGAARDAADRIEIPLADLFKAIWQRRLWLVIVTVIGTLLAIGWGFLLPNQYTSTAQLMPPDPGALSSMSLLSALQGGSSAIAPSLAGGLMSQKTPSGTFIGILNSASAQDDIINRFDLRRLYHCKFYEDARKVLGARTVIEEDPKSGIISIKVTDPDPNRARDLTKAYVEELDKLVNKASTSSARRERVFLEERLQSIKDKLDASSTELSQFSSRNATFDPLSQGQSVLGSAEKLQGELIVAQSQLSGLRSTYTDDNVKVKQARATVDELQSQLQKLSGAGEHSDTEGARPGNFQPSLRKLPLLEATYVDLFRQVKMQEGVYETLNKQYELAKVQEAKEIPPIKVLDDPEVPERKSGPHRSIFAMAGFIVSMLLGTVWIIVRKMWELTDASNPVKAFVIDMARTIRGRKAATP